MKITLLLAGIATTFAIPAVAQTAADTAEAKAQAAVSTADAAQAGQKVTPDRTPTDPANNVKGMGSAAGAQMQSRMATQNAPGAMPEMMGVVVGKTVQDTAGNAVGVIEEVEGDLAVLATDTAKVRIPKGSFADRNGVLVIAMTKDQVNAAATRAPGTAPTSN